VSKRHDHGTCTLCGGILANSQEILEGLLPNIDRMWGIFLSILLYKRTSNSSDIIDIMSGGYYHDTDRTADRITNSIMQHMEAQHTDGLFGKTETEPEKKERLRKASVDKAYKLLLEIQRQDQNMRGQIKKALGTTSRSVPPATTEQWYKNIECLLPKFQEAERQSISGKCLELIKAAEVKQKDLYYSMKGVQNKSADAGRLKNYDTAFGVENSLLKKSLDVVKA
jgi:hypothetical protein